MANRRVHENIALDQSLRQSRAIWLSLALIFVPVAIFGVLRIFAAMAALVDGLGTALASVVWDLLIGTVLVAADAFMFGRFREATRRLKILHDNPNAEVRSVPAPFQSSLFGPYH